MFFDIAVWFRLHKKGVTLIALCSFALFFLSGCEQAREDLQNWSRKNSLQKRSGSQNPSLANRDLVDGCPPGMKPFKRNAGDRGTPVCVAQSDDGPGSFEERYPDGRLKTKIIHKGEALRVSHWYENGNPKDETHFYKNEKHGLWTQWHRNGKKQYQVDYRNGHRHGNYTAISERGATTETGKYSEGFKSSIWVENYLNGKTKSRRTWLTGKLQGNAEEFDQNGVLFEHGTYVDNRKNGRWVGYHSNGNLRYVGFFHQGKQHGKWTEYGSMGEVIATNYFKYGNPDQKIALRGKVPFTSGDILGARPPEDYSGRAVSPQRKNQQPSSDPKRLNRGSGWVRM